MRSRKKPAALADVSGEILVAHPVAAGSRDDRRDRARQICRSGGDCRLCFSSTRRWASFRKAGRVRRWRRSRNGSRRPPSFAATANGSGVRRRNWCPAMSSGFRSAHWCRPMRAFVSGSVMVDQSMLTGESVPVDANPGEPSLRRIAGAARSSDRRSHGDRNEDLFRAHRRTGAHGPCRQHRAGRHLCGDAKSRARERHGRDRHRHLRLCHGIAAERSHPACPDRAAGHDSGGAAGDVHAVGRIRRADTRPARRPADAPLGRARSRRHGRPVRRQDRDADAQRVGGRRCRRDARLRSRARAGAGGAGEFRGGSGPDRRRHSGSRQSRSQPARPSGSCGSFLSIRRPRVRKPLSSIAREPNCASSRAHSR